jgi:hypothetical protein
MTPRFLILVCIGAAVMATGAKLAFADGHLWGLAGLFIGGGFVLAAFKGVK